jgi:dihydroorotate dehydrogenase electron transfer subunit
LSIPHGQLTVMHMMPTIRARDHRATIYLEEASVISQDAYDGEQYILQVQAPACAASAMPGNFAHLRCGPSLPMRRPLSIMRVDRAKGRVDFLYKAVGRGTRELAARKAGDRISMIGPIGKPFMPDSRYPRKLLLGGGVGMPPMVFLAQELSTIRDCLPVIMMASEVPFPFRPCPSRFLLSGMPEDVIAAMPLMEDWGIPGRLASLQGYPGCFEGYVTELARSWLGALDKKSRREIEVFACGPRAMLEATARMAIDYGLPCQVSVEEFMACGVGGCAGCTVQIRTVDGPAMKRVCVDGPVFNAREIF